MDYQLKQIINKNAVFGFNHTTAPIEIREKYALDELALEKVVKQLKEIQGNNIIVVSTCNRTELFCHSDNYNLLLTSFLKILKCPFEDFECCGFIKTGEKALIHMLSVTNGLKSLVQGDYQIIGQFRNSFQIAEKHMVFNAFIERFIQTINQCSKQVKNETEFSTGSASVAYLTTKLLANNPDKKKVLLIGLGEIGKTVLKNLFKNKNIQVSVSTRNEEKLHTIAREYDINYVMLNDIKKNVHNFDVIISAIQSNEYVLDSELNITNKLLIDLSIPRSIHPKLENTNKILTIDSFTTQLDNTLKKRMHAIPEVENIIKIHLQNYYDWLEFTLYSPVLKQLKEKFDEIRNTEIDKLNKNDSSFSETEKITAKVTNKIFNHIAQFVKETQKGDLNLTVEQLANFKNEH